MIYKQTTQVPNELFDIHLPKLSEAELKVFLIIIRQTYGWVNMKTGKRKSKDRISHSQFIKKTSLCRRVISNSIKSLVTKGLINISDYGGNVLNEPTLRKGKSSLIYSPVFVAAIKESSIPKTLSKYPLFAVNKVRSIAEILRE